MKKFLSIGEVANEIGVSVPTLRRWDRKGLFKSDKRTFGNHRRYSLSSVFSFLGEKRKRKVVGYARVSSHDQKLDLERQRDVLSIYSDEVITDLGSGINFKKKGLINLIERIISGELSEIVITHKDRLLRFGFELIHKLCSFFNVNIRILNDATPVSFEQELSQDIVILMTVFSARYYGKRSHKNKTKVSGIA